MPINTQLGDKVIRQLQQFFGDNVWGFARSRNLYYVVIRDPRQFPWILDHSQTGFKWRKDFPIAIMSEEHNSLYLPIFKDRYFQMLIDLFKDACP